MFSLDFNQLCEGYEEYETYVFDSVSHVAIKFIEKPGLKFKENLFLPGDLHHSLKVLFDTVDKIVTILLIRGEAIAKGDFGKKEIKINHPGRIKSIVTTQVPSKNLNAE